MIIDEVIGQVRSGEIRFGPVQFRLRATVSTEATEAIFNMVNSVVFESPDGAGWTTPLANVIDQQLGDWYESLVIDVLAADGLSPDSVVIGFINLMADSGGAPPGYNGQIVEISFTFALEDVGRTICVDSVNGGGLWLWELVDPWRDFVPEWHGPYCFTITDCPGEPDPDGDGIRGECDNCPDVNSSDLTDSDWDYVGDVCDICPGYDDNVDSDGDGIPDGCDKCCVGRVGDTNGSGDDEPTIGDVSLMIDAKFIGGNCEDLIICKADGDISMLIDYLFITGPDVATLPECL